jgi:excinuclease ABC subunit B
VSLVAILDADKEGFLRSETALIQTIGRAARHVEGQVIMYADRVTNSMQRAIDETNRRREMQQAYNEQHGIVPQTITKEMVEMLPVVEGEEEVSAGVSEPAPAYETVDQFAEIEQLEAEMKTAASALEFERAAQLRDKIVALRQQRVVKCKHG